MPKKSSFIILTLLLFINFIFTDKISAANVKTRGGIVFYDSFEGDLSKWTTVSATAGSISTSTEDVAAGAKGLKLYLNDVNSNVTVIKNLGVDLPTASAKVFFNDDITSTKASIFFVKDLSGSNMTGVGVNTSISANNFVIRQNGTFMDSGVARSKGWHLFEVKTNGSSAQVYIDDRAAGNVNSLHKTIGQVQLVNSWNITGRGYYDELKVIDEANLKTCSSVLDDDFSDISDWNIEETGNLNTVSNFNYQGKNSINLTVNDTSGFVSAFKVKCSGGYGKLKISFYDDLTAKGTIAAVYSGNVGTNTSSQVVGIGVWTSLQDDNGLWQDKDTYIYRVGNNLNPQANTIPTGVKRTAGWHTFEFYSTPVGTYGVIDGINLTYVNGKKSAAGFTYNINQDSSFINNGIQSIGLVSTWNAWGATRYADLSFSSINTTFPYQKTNADMAKASLDIAKYFINQYPYSTEPSFYAKMIAGDLNDGHRAIQDYNQMVSVSSILALDHLVNTNPTSLSKALKLTNAVIDAINDPVISSKVLKCNSTPYFYQNLTLNVRMLWEALDLSRQQKVLANLKSEADFWMNITNLSSVTGCVNPWGSKRNTLPYARDTSATDINLMNSATRDNAWTGGMYTNIVDFPEFKYKTDQVTLNNYLNFAKILAYHSLTVPSSAPYGTHPVTGQGPLAVYPTLLSNYYNPTVWASPNVFYTYTTVQQTSRGLISQLINGEYRSDSVFYNNWATSVNAMEPFIDWNQFRSKSEVEAGVPQMQPNTSAFDLWGKGHQYEDLSVNVDTLAYLSQANTSYTSLNKSTYYDRLYNLLKYEYFTLNGKPRLPYNTFLQTSNALCAMSSFPLNTNLTEMPFCGWGAQPSNTQPILFNPMLSLLISGVIHLDHVYASIILAPPGALKIDLTQTDKAKCYANELVGTNLSSTCSNFISNFRKFDTVKDLHELVKLLQL